jgi:DNA-binding GntR family transcriptional regulator
MTPPSLDSRVATGFPEGGALNRRSSGDQVASHIRQLIFQGELKRADRIRQDDVAEQLGVSRIPVREAIIALAHEGWLTIEPHRGAYVIGLDPESIVDHYEVLGLLFGLTGKRATARAEDSDVADFVRLQKALKAATDPEAVHLANEQLIRRMYAMAASRRLSSVARSMTGIVPGNFFALVPGATEAQKKGTAAVSKALQAREADRVADEWLTLLRRQGDLVVALLESRGVFKAA